MTDPHGGFLLTRPSRGATPQGIGKSTILDISTHTPLAGRDYSDPDNLSHYQISTHTPLAGRDVQLQPLASILQISTHTPLAGRDRTRRESHQGASYFYSHAPRGARQ